jgi:hypothetical protein
MRIKTNSLQPNFNAIYQQQRQTSSTERERYFALRESTIDNIMNILVSGVTTTITTNDKDSEFKMRLGWLTEIILV